MRFSRKVQQIMMDIAGVRVRIRVPVRVPVPWLIRIGAGSCLVSLSTMPQNSSNETWPLLSVSAMAITAITSCWVSPSSACPSSTASSSISRYPLRSASAALNTSRVRVQLRLRLGLGLRLEGGGVDSAIATLDKKACEGLVWLAMHPAGVKIGTGIRVKVFRNEGGMPRCPAANPNPTWKVGKSGWRQSGAPDTCSKGFGQNVELSSTHLAVGSRDEKKVFLYKIDAASGDVSKQPYRSYRVHAATFGWSLALSNTHVASAWYDSEAILLAKTNVEGDFPVNAFSNDKVSWTDPLAKNKADGSMSTLKASRNSQMKKFKYVGASAAYQSPLQGFGRNIKMSDMQYLLLRH